MSTSPSGVVKAQPASAVTLQPNLLIIQPTLNLVPLLLVLPTPMLTTNINNSGLMFTKGLLKYSSFFTGSMDVKNPSVMLLGDSDSITLTITPASITNDSAIQPELLGVADKISILPAVQPEKPINGTSQLTWTWVVDPKVTGKHVLLLNITYKNTQAASKATSARWESIEVDLTVQLPPSETPTPTLTPTITPSPTKTPSFTVAPTLTFTVTPIPTFTSTPTLTTGEVIKESLASNVVTLIGILVTLLLGVLTLYFQTIRKSDKNSAGK